MQPSTPRSVPGALCALACLLCACLPCASCVLPMIDQAVLSHAKDATPPTLTILSPADGTLCANIAEVKGAVTDLADGGSPGKVASLSWKVLGTALGDAVEPAADGSFTVQFQTVTAGGSFTFQLTATDWNGNSATASVSLKRDAATAIPDFTAAASSKSVTLTWSAVPKTNSYTLYYTTNGSLPSATNGTTVTDVSSPCVVSGCPNGALCLFRLVANPETGWSASESDYAQAIPLSARSLAPQAFGEVGQIRVQWPQISATNQFALYRRAGETGDFTRLGTVTGTEYVDTGLTQGSDYWYAVKPASGSDVMSEANGACPALAASQPTITGSVATSDNATACAIAGSTWAYSSSNATGFKVVNIANPTSPTSVDVAYPGSSGVTTLGTASAFCVSGSNLFVGAGSGILWYDITTPSAPTFLRGLEVGVSTKSIVVNSSYLYIGCWSGATGTARLVTLNTTTHTMTLGGAFLTSSYAVSSMALYSNTLYVPENLTLHVYDVTTPQSPSAKPSVTLATGGSEVYVGISGACACVGAGQNCYYYSLATPTAPALAATVTINAQINGLGIWGQRCVLLTSGYMLFSYDVADPAKPFLAYSVEVPGNYGVGFASAGSVAVMANWSAGIQVLYDPGQYFPRTGRLTINSGTTFDATCLQVVCSRAYLAGPGTGATARFGVYDVSGSGNPVPLSSSGITGMFYGMAVSGRYAYLVSPPNGSATGLLTVVDVADPRNPVVAGTLDLPGGGTGWGIGVYGDLAVITNSTSRLLFVDVSDPAAPTLTPRSVTLDGKAVGRVVVYAHHAYVIASLYAAECACVDLRSTGDAPAVTTLIAASPAIAGSYAFARDNHAGSMGLYATNVADPFNPVTIGVAKCSGGYVDADAAISGGYAYTASWNTGIQRFSVANPSRPSCLLTVGGTMFAKAIAASGTRAAAIQNDGSYVYLDVYSLAP
jgi:hypothetical protein